MPNMPCAPLGFAKSRSAQPTIAIPGSPANANTILRHITGNNMSAVETSKHLTEASRSERGTGFRRSIGLFSGTTINMTQMCGIGPFITIPIMVATMGGPQAIVGWIAGAILAASDGMVWAELGAAMPGSGGTYVYLREAFQYRTGKLMPFLFIWTVLLTIPLIMSTGIIGMVEYLGFFFPHLSWTAVHLISVLASFLAVFLLYRRIEIGRAHV